MDALLLMPSTLNRIIHEGNQTSRYNNTGLVSQTRSLSASKSYLLGKVIQVIDLFIVYP